MFRQQRHCSLPCVYSVCVAILETFVTLYHSIALHESWSDHGKQYADSPTTSYPDQFRIRELSLFGLATSDLVWPEYQ